VPGALQCSVTAALVMSTLTRQREYPLRVTDCDRAHRSGHVAPGSGVPCGNISYPLPHPTAQETSFTLCQTRNSNQPALLINFCGYFVLPDASRISSLYGASDCHEFTSITLIITLLVSGACYSLTYLSSHGACAHIAC
jgi:hypothetical protein